MAVAENSFGGWIMAARELEWAGINPHSDFSELTFGGTRMDEDDREYTGRITGICRRMAGLIDDLLAYSRLGRKKIRIKSISLGPFVKEALGLLESPVREKMPGLT